MIVNLLRDVYCKFGVQFSKGIHKATRMGEGVVVWHPQQSHVGVSVDPKSIKIVEEN